MQIIGTKLLFRFGIRSTVSWQDAYIFFIETLCQEIEIGNSLHAVFLDCSIAFDSVHRGIFLKKLETLNFSHSLVECIGTFSWKRLHQVTVNRIVFDWIEMKQEVPPGTILGPLLLRLHNNLLSNQSGGNAFLLHYSMLKTAFSFAVIRK